MKRNAVFMSKILVTAALTVSATHSAFAGPNAADVAKAAAEAAILQKHKALVKQDLLQYREREVRYLTPDQVEALNQRDISDLLSLKIERRLKNRTPDITREDAQAMINSIEYNPVTSSYAYRKYSPVGREIGFCFGRAMYGHILGLHLGVQKESIKKAWVVGPMNSGGIMWSFHVTTLMKSGDTWLAIDNYPGQLLTVDEWLKHMQPQSVDKKLRIYITDAEKFVGGFGYDSVQLNHFGDYKKYAELPRDRDWYSGFFKDMLNWFASKPDLSTVGLPSTEEFRKAHEPPVPQVPRLPEQEMESID
ncbi:MAG: hypothetical protein V4692_15705 [Bdellovibrionota bacterium]